MTPTSSTPPSDAEVIERVLDAEERWDNSNATGEIRQMAAVLKAAAPDLARRLQSALTRISSLERELGASDAALIAVGREYIYRGEDTGSIRDAIEAARRRSTT